ncbi:MAG: DNRLRE domain-containing protein [Planctomycetes bacterium]|nr:DNRLRE domain-containing protein [Planctomycetota bacterium]
MNSRILSVLAVLSPCVVAMAQTATVQLVPSQDNTLYEDAAGLISNGQGQYLFVGLTSTGVIRRSLLAFDVVSAVPAHSRIVDVQLAMTVRQSNAVGPDGATLHRVTTAWGEGASMGTGNEGSGGVAAPGDATWTHAVLPTTPWTTLGGDYVAAVSSSTALPVVGGFSFEKTERMLADVQDWLDGQPNNGWLIRTDELANGTARRIDSRNNTTATAMLPTLTVTYLLPGNIQSFGTGCSTSGNMNLFQSVTGPVAQGNTPVLTVQSGVPLGLFVTLLSFDVRPEPLEPAAGCFWWLRDIPYPNLGIKVQDNLGNYAEPFSIPQNPALFGIPLALQSVLVDWAHPRQWALSNADLICIN